MSNSLLASWKKQEHCAICMHRIKEPLILIRQLKSLALFAELIETPGVRENHQLELAATAIASRCDAAAEPTPCTAKH